MAKPAIAPAQGNVHKPKKTPFGWAMIDGHEFYCTGITLEKGMFHFVLVYEGTLTIPQYCKVEMFGRDSSRLFTLHNFNINTVGGPVSCTAGTITVFLPLNVNRVDFGEHYMPEVRGTDLPATPGKVYPFMDARVGNKAYTYQQANGDPIHGEYGWVTDLDYFDDRYGELKLIRKKWVLLEEDVLVLEDPMAKYRDDE